jgi:hypothetical protein
MTDKLLSLLPRWFIVVITTAVLLTVAVLTWHGIDILVDGGMSYKRGETEIIIGPGQPRSSALPSADTLRQPADTLRQLKPRPPQASHSNGAKTNRLRGSTSLEGFSVFSYPASRDEF